MRIALFTETYLPHVNGIVTHVKSLKDGLERLGHEVLQTAFCIALRAPPSGSMDMISRCLCQQRA